MQGHVVLSCTPTRKRCPALTGSTIFLLSLSLLVAVLTAPFLSYQILRITTAAGIDYNEGWNVFHASLLAKQGILYRPFDDLPIIPVDYPPLSFPIVSAVSYLTGSLLLAGRLVSLLSFAAVAVLIFAAIRIVTRSTPAAAIAGLLWLGLISRISGAYVGMNDPQMLGHLFSVGALYLFCRWRPRFNTLRIFIVAALCVLGLLVKHSLVSVPFALGIVLLFSNQRDFFRFAASGTVFGSLLLLACIVWNGVPAVTNLTEIIPLASTELLLSQYAVLFLDRGLWALALPLAALSLLRPAPGLFVVYLLSSFGFGTLAMRGLGCDVNHLFDFFIAAALLLGFCAGRFDEAVQRAADGADHAGSWRPLLLALSISAIAAAVILNEVTLARFASSDGVLERSTIATLRFSQTAVLLTGIGTVLFLQRLVESLKGFSVRSAAKPLLLMIVLGGTLTPVARQYARDLSQLDYQEMKSVEQHYLADVRRLQAIPGPALFEDPLIGFDAGKEFLFDPFLGSMLMSKGRLPEDVLIRRIRERAFGAIVLRLQLADTLKKPRGKSGPAKRTFSDRWTDNVLKAMGEYYEPDFRGGRGVYFFYRPRNL
jgi:hypothetical protein